MSLVRLPVNSKLLVVWGSQKLDAIFQLLGGRLPNPHAVQESSALWDLL